MAAYKKRINFIIFDLLILLIGYFFFALLVFRNTQNSDSISYHVNFLAFAAIWITISLLFQKFNIQNRSNFKELLIPMFLSNTIAALTYIICKLYTPLFQQAQQIIYATIIITTAFDIFFIRLLSSISKLDVQPEVFFHNILHKTELSVKNSGLIHTNYTADKLLLTRENILKHQLGNQVTQFIMRYIDISEKNLVFTDTHSVDIINTLTNRHHPGIIILSQLNRIKELNLFLSTVNNKITTNSLIFGHVETLDTRKSRFKNSKFKLLSNLWNSVSVFFHRTIPQIPVLDVLYIYRYKHKNKPLSKTESFGRLYACGFALIDELQLDNGLYFVASKVCQPLINSEIHYGPLLKLNRIGKHGKIIKVYKMRTMYPYSEFLQNYMYQKNNLKSGGKIKNDFRIYTLGKWLRKYWIDEIPMIYNILKGDIKLIGVRPLSKQYFNLYSPELQKMRTCVKPGLIPPFYFDLPKTIDEIQKSEEKYLYEFGLNPVKTDIKYFFGAWYNIIIRGARSD